MKSVLQKSSILFFVFFHVSIWGQTNVSGDITANTTWQVSKSPYNLVGFTDIKNGAKLTIESGVKVYLQNNTLSFAYNSGGAILDANGVTFNNGELRFANLASGTVTNCSFTNVRTNFYDTSNPLITNNTYDLNSPLYFYTEEAFPRISGNSYGNKKLYLDFDITKNITFKNITDVDYYLVGFIDVKNGAKLTIESGVKVFLQNNTLSFAYNSGGAILDANGITFNNGELRFANQASGTVTNCSFTNVRTNFYDTSNPSITNNTFDLSSPLYFYTEEAFPRISGNSYGNKKLYLDFDITKNITFKNITDIDYYLVGGIEAKNGAKLTIESGVKVYLQNNTLSFAYNSGGAIIDANGITFNNGELRFANQSSGTVTNCSFTNVRTNLYDTSNPAITNNTFDSSSPLSFYSEEAFPRISGNIFGNKKLYLDFDITKNITFKKITDVDYYLVGGIEVKNGAKLTIETGIKIFLQNNTLSFSYNAGGGILDANGVTFNNGELRFANLASGTISNCELQNTRTNVYDNGVLSFSKSNFDIFSKIENKSSKNVNAVNNYWGDATGPKHSTNPNGYGTTISDKVDYIPFATTPFDIAVGVEEISRSIPVDFSLKQNYPNPFNPSTLINYSVPKQSKVTIIIYDALGRELTTLVNEEKLVGNYTVEFNAYLLSSGIYFYQMKIDGFIQTKKMLLLR